MRSIRDEDGIRYINCGDWVESCTAIVEHDDGHFEIITWADQMRKAGDRSAGCSPGRLMRILVATDAWHPQVNGVVRTLTKLADAAKVGSGVEFTFLTPESFRTFAMPSYRDVRLAMPRPARIAKLIAEARPDSIHIATEGPIGLMVRRYCRQRKLPFTSSFHTRFPEYARRPRSGSGRPDLAGAAPLPCAQPGRDGGNAGARARTHRPRLRQRSWRICRRGRRFRPSSRAPLTTVVFSLVMWNFFTQAQVGQLDRFQVDAQSL
ncbi:MAG: hypothetical protein QM811_21085 [Pirellulales bacterium]